MTLGPDDQWPDHGKPAWREALGNARSRGWNLEPSSGHIFGTLKCPTGVCTMKVLRSGIGTEAVAQQCIKKVESCTHSPKHQGLVDRVSTRVRNATRLVTAAERLMHKHRTDTRVDELLDESADALSGEDVAEFERLVDEQDDLRRALEVELQDVDGEHRDVDGVLQLADQNVTAARQVLRTAPREAPRVKRLWKEVTQLRERIRALRKKHAAQDRPSG